MERIRTVLMTNRVAKITEIALVFTAALVIILVFARPASQEHLIHNQVVLWFANVLMMLVVVAGVLLRGEKISSLGLSFELVTVRSLAKFIGLSLLVFVIATAFYILGSAIMINITGLPQQADMSSYDYMKDNPAMLAASLVGAYIAASFGEELIYRGFLITRITELLNIKPGVAISTTISAVIFGLVHYNWGPAGVVQTTFMGLALGICFIWLKRKLWILIAAHAIMDTILIVQVYLSIN